MRCFCTAAQREEPRESRNIFANTLLRKAPTRPEVSQESFDSSFKNVPAHNSKLTTNRIIPAGLR
jgi:hypothetical protein